MELPFDQPSTNDRDRPLTVSQLTWQVRRLIERDFTSVWVEGEISNWSVAGSGHAYFALKDENALLGAVMWKTSLRTAKGPFRDGDRVEARGRLTLYEKRGQYQLVVESLRPVGEGALWQKFLQMKARLEAEGLFDPARKRPIPALPRAVGVVTSPTGAAIRDILSILHRRAPGLAVYVYPARVQGEGAAAEVARGIAALGGSGLVDVLIVGRGGGSLEDLWAFNEEAVARAVAACPIPVVSAVGHEVDFTICDFVADLRAPTPSAAAEMVSAEHQQVARRLVESRQRLDRAIDRMVMDARGRVRAAVSSYALRTPENLLLGARQRTDDALRRLDDAVEERLGDLATRLRAANAALSGHDPSLILSKGYAIVRRERDGKVLTRAVGLKPGARLETEFVDGRVPSTVTDGAADLFDGG